MKVLITGFNAFGGLSNNPSEQVVTILQQRATGYTGVQLLTEVLPTAFVASGERITHLINHHLPDIIIMLGVDEGSSAIALEKIAQNINDTTLPDNDGYAPSGQVIVPDGPETTMGNFPINDLYAVLTATAIPVTISYSAGTFVCNHVYYVTNYTVAQLGSDALCGFVHIPMPSASFGIVEITRAIEQIMEHLVQHRHQIKTPESTQS